MWREKNNKKNTSKARQYSPALQLTTARPVRGWRPLQFGTTSRVSAVIARCEATVEMHMITAQHAAAQLRRDTPGRWSKGPF